MNLSGNISASMSIAASTTAGPLTPGVSANPNKAITFTAGTAAGQTDSLIAKISTTLAAGATDLIDLTGSFVDAFGAIVANARVLAIFLINKTDPVSVPSAVLEVGAAAANPLANLFKTAATDAIHVRPGGFLAIGAGDGVGYAVTAATADILAIKNIGSGVAAYELYIMGCSA